MQGELTDDEQELLEAGDPATLAILLMLSKKEENDDAPSSLHANIAGPIVLNLEKKIGLQKVLVSARMDVNIRQS